MPVENGFVPTPGPVADYAAAMVFGALRPPEVDDGRILFPGLGTGRLYDAVRRYCTPGEGWYPCRSWDFNVPECVGVENDPQRIAEFREAHPDAPIEVLGADFLLDPPEGQFDWVLANPPFIRYNRLDTERRAEYRERFSVADGQFPLYAPFLEQALRLLRPGGWLTFILPMAALTTGVCEPVRWLIRRNFAGPIMNLPDETFDETVSTFLLGLQKCPDGDPHPLWLEHLYGPEARDILNGLGVEDVEAALDRYYEEHSHSKTLLQWRVSNEMKDDRQEHARQSALLEYSGSEC